MTEIFQDFFSIKIYRKKIDESVVQNIGKEIQGCSNDILGLMKGNTFNQENQPVFSDPHFESNFILEKNLNILRNEILKSAYEYLLEYNSTSSFPVSFKRSWVTYCAKNTWGHLHNHNDCMISGVYYYQTDENSGKLRLYSPLQFSRGYNNNFLDIQPEQGSIVMFPGWMGHEILPNHSDNMRISIAFNLI